MILHNRYGQVQQAIASFQEQIAQLQQQVLEYQEHLQKLETLEAAAESAVIQVTNAIQMVRAIDPSQEEIIKTALLELFELPTLPAHQPHTDSTSSERTPHGVDTTVEVQSESIPDTDNTPSEVQPHRLRTDSAQTPHGVNTTVEVRSEYTPDTDSTPTVHHPDTVRSDSEQPPHGVDTITARLSSMTNSQLKTLLGEHKLPKNGNKPVLIQRILDSIDPWDLESLI